MLRLLALSLKLFCVAFALTLALVAHAEQTKPPAPVVGATRDQVVTQLGEPKSQLKAGSREVLIFTRWKLTLRNDVVSEVEDLGEEPQAKPAAIETPAASPQASAPPARTNQPAPTPIAPDGESEAPPPAAKPAAAVAQPTPSTAEDDAPIAIKSIRRPGAGKTLRPSPASVTPATAPPTASVAPSSKSLPVVQNPPASSVPKVPPLAAVNAAESRVPPVAASAAAPTVESTTSSDSETVAPSESAASDAADSAVQSPAEPTKTKAKAKGLFRRKRVDPGEPEVSFITGQTYVLAIIAVGVGVAFLYWRRSQRALELAATAVSRTPFTEAPVETGATFTVELLGRLDAARFERLVASYYSKTGVVAESTKAGPESAVHIKIFWKGEPKPFAGVQCHARPSGLIPALPLQNLFAALNEAEIRRGYVVTAGKFTVEARDFAEEKHFTLLSGDLFLEKLNALPAAARSDLLRETSTEAAASADRIGA